MFNYNSVIITLNEVGLSGIQCANWGSHFQNGGLKVKTKISTYLEKKNNLRKLPDLISQRQILQFNEVNISKYLPDNYL